MSHQYCNTNKQVIDTLVWIEIRIARAVTRQAYDGISQIAPRIVVRAPIPAVSTSQRSSRDVLFYDVLCVLAHSCLRVGQDCNRGASCLLWLPPNHLKVQHASNLPMSIGVGCSERSRTQQTTFLACISMDLDRVLGSRRNPAGRSEDREDVQGHSSTRSIVVRPRGTNESYLRG